LGCGAFVCRNQRGDDPDADSKGDERARPGVTAITYLLDKAWCRGVAAVAEEHRGGENGGRRFSAREGREWLSDAGVEIG
jgi:hypothetical protein